MTAAGSTGLRVGLRHPAVVARAAAGCRRPQEVGVAAGAGRSGSRVRLTATTRVAADNPGSEEPEPYESVGVADSVVVDPAAGPMGGPVAEVYGAAAGRAPSVASDRRVDCSGPVGRRFRAAAEDCEEAPAEDVRIRRGGG